MSSPTLDEIRRYYDDFARSRMTSRGRTPNLRIRLATDFFLSRITAGDSILDIGCGVGLATEVMARRAAPGYVAGVDISQECIRIARCSTNLDNLQFACGDALSMDLSSLLPCAPTVITLCDVIEHIPEPLRPELLHRLSAVGAANATLLVTYPTEFNLEFFAREDPSQLQIVDNRIPIHMLATEAAQAGFSLSDYSILNVWRCADYAHCIFERHHTLRRRMTELAPPRPPHG